MRKWTGIAIIVLAVVAVNIAVQLHVVRWDMTDDKRYSLSDATKQLLREYNTRNGGNESIVITDYLNGELNAGFKRLSHALKETVEEMQVYGDITYRQALEGEAEQAGLRPTVIHEKSHNGQTARTTIYPYVEVRLGGKKMIAELLKNNRGLSGDENLNNSIENIEYTLSEAILTISREDTIRVAFLEGHGELSERYVWDLTQQLSHYMQVDRGIAGTRVEELLPYRAIIIADPQHPFSDKDKFLLDQYVMHGGRVLWIVNGVQFSQEGLSSDGYTPAIPMDLSLSDMLFRYGVRIVPALIQDAQCLPVPVNVSTQVGETNYQPMPWYYAPLLLTSQASPITRNIMQVSSAFCSPIEVVGGEDGIHKEVLLATSTASRLIPTPAKVDLSDLNPDMEEFKWQYIPVGILLEGSFTSFFAHRMMPEGVEATGITKESVPTRQIVIACGSVIRNEWQQGQVLPLGYDRYTGMQFGNRDVLLNAVLYLCDNEGLMSLRQRQVTLRLLNDQRAHAERKMIQTICVIAPIVLLAMVVLIVIGIRKHNYTKR